ncbi:MAG: CBS domain-containing protein [Promethearchaeota archaeon]
MKNEYKDFAELPIIKIMIKDPLFTTPDEKVSVTELFMLRKKVSGLPVVNDKKQLRLVGIITQRDIRLARFAMSLDNPYTLVKDLMTPNPIVLQENDTIKNALDKLFENQIERLPVINDKFQLVGLILERTILKSLKIFLDKLHYTNQLDKRSIVSP